MQNKTLIQRSLPASTLLLLLCGCSRSPSIDVLGSYFPAWIVCCTVGIVLALGTYFLLVRLKFEPAIPVKTFVYPCAAAAYTLLIWLIFYS